MTSHETPPMRDRIAAALETAFRIDRLEVEDESEGHRGHSGWREGGETHFHVRLDSPDLAPLSRLARHRAVHAALGAELVAQIHALRLTLQG